MSVQTAASGAKTWVRDSTTQQRGAGNLRRNAVPRDPPLRRRQGVVCVGAHGGAGATTLAKALSATELGREVPISGEVLVVGRTNAGGLQSVSRMLNSIVTDPRQQARVVAVALVADAPGRLPRPLSHRVRVISSAARIYRIPWVPEWRLGAEPAELPKEIRKLAELLGDLQSRTRESR
ncbi:hypothetical protein FKR81_41055 [Lentzea tibetensis]|uniref:Uncharacterized protein n=1 Tax=Lentzea tibetensis TaxID=2591470 RepID=A0A563EFR6_9PSEU|nr:DUF6668 family protein [Lentzea tibetensis]TWP44516.1 hypothetical protein FKR81_41055 [Lentzea tibetensis]